MLRLTSVLYLLALTLPATGFAADEKANVLDAIAGPGPEGETGAPEISTQELRAVLAAKRALIFDARSPAEFATGHLPGALNVSGKLGLPPSKYTSDMGQIEKLVKGNRSQPIILYCNGIHCGRSRRLADDLRAAGFTDVNRYQLGMPVWRALGGVQQIELQALLEVLENDRTAVLLDARGESGLPGSRPVPLPEVRKAKDDGRLPMDDHHTRVIVVGANAAQAQAVADGVARDAFDNVSFFAGDAAVLERSLKERTAKRAIPLEAPPSAPSAGSGMPPRSSPPAATDRN